MLPTLFLLFFYLFLYASSLGSFFACSRSLTSCMRTEPGLPHALYWRKFGDGVDTARFKTRIGSTVYTLVMMLRDLFDGIQQPATGLPVVCEHTTVVV